MWLSGASLLPRASELPCGVIHSDINDQNVLVDAAGASLVGVIDFGDMVRSWQLNELAICAAYVLIYLSYDKWFEGGEGGGEAAAAAEGGMAMEPLLALRAVCRGYNAERQLSEAEWAALPTLISCRLAMSLTIGMFSAAQDPDNEYLRLTLRPGWRALQLMRGKATHEWSEALRGA